MRQQKQRHPWGLWVLGGAEVWERMSFYMMKAMLPYYCGEQLAMSQAEASEVIGNYIMAVYAAPLIGGYLADRVFGFLRAALLGALVMVAGHAVMTQPSRPALYLAMALIAVGNGLFKPSMLCMVRGLYTPGDPRVDSANSIFYFAVNLGAAAAGVLAAKLRARFGFHVAFGAAGVGLFIGLMQLYLQRRHILHAARPSAIAAATGVPIEDPKYQDAPLPHEGRRVLVILGLTVCAMVFWMAFYQDASTVPLFVRDNIERHGVEPESFASVNPIFVLLFTAPVVWLYTRLQIRTATRVVIGMALASAAYVVFSMAAHRAGADRVSMVWFIVAIFVLTIGELLVSPGGNALISKLAPPRYMGLLVGIWLLSSSFGGKAAGKIGALWTKMDHSLFFLAIAGAAAAMGVLVLAFRKSLQDVLDLATQSKEEPQETALPAAQPQES
jgi:POT family proton-dependent oligopeptide transporter